MKKNNSKLVEKQNKDRKIKGLMKIGTFVATLVMMFTLTTVFAFADETNPVEMINNLGELFKSVVVAVGAIVTIFGGFNFGLSFQTHDNSQRTQGVLGILSGVIVICTPYIVEYVTK